MSKELQTKAYKELISLNRKLIEIQKSIKDFAIEDAIDTIILACHNYMKEEE